MATKSFKIGEYAIGGIIKVDIAGNLVGIHALDWSTKKPVKGNSFKVTNTLRPFQEIDSFLNDLTSSYYAGKILEWIESKTNLL